MFDDFLAVFDSNIWEELDENSFEIKDGWESLKYNESNKEFNVINNYVTFNCSTNVEK